ncbi:hypothetical protein LCU68_003975 [Salmonella enterica]|nr:hypothetical protein [Salmonella enterica]
MVSFWNKKEEIYAELERLRAIIGESESETIISENKQLRDLIMDAHKPFYELDKEKKKEINSIFDLHHKADNPDSIYYVIGQAAAYILRGKLPA